MTLIATALISSLLTTTPVAPVTEPLREAANRLRHAETDDDGSGVDTRSMQEEALKERETGVEDSRTTEQADDEAEPTRRALENRRANRIRRATGPDRN